MTATAPTTPDALIRLSIDQHHRMAHLLHRLQEELELQAFEKLTELNDELSGIQDQARLVDDELLRCLQGGPPAAALLPLLAQRTALQKDIVALLAAILPGAKSVKSLLADEMQTLKTGRTALSGYKSGTMHQGRLINSAT